MLPRSAQSDRVQLHDDDLPNQLFRQVGMFPQWKRDIFENIQISQQCALLEQNAQLSSHVIKPTPRTWTEDFTFK